MNILQLLQTLTQQFPDFEWTTPPDPTLGILTTNQAFIAAKELKQNPKDAALVIAQTIRDYIADQDLPLVANVVGPYINIDITSKGWQSLLETGLDYQLSQDDTKVLLDYVGANVAKQLHAGHMRNLNIGDALRRILHQKYPELVTDNHWGDWGVNMGILLWGWKKEGSQEQYNQDPIKELMRVYVWANGQKDVHPQWDQEVRQEFYRLEQKDEENYRLWQEFIITTKHDLSKDLALMGVPPLDIEQGESFYEADMKFLGDFMETHNLWEKDGLARYFDMESLAQSWQGIDDNFRKQVASFGRCYLISSTGYTSYCFRDVAARLNWARDLGAGLMISVTDKTQRHNFDQAFSIICYLASLPEFQATQTQETIQKLRWDNLKHIGYGFLTLETGKMSSRKGNVLSLRDLFAQVKETAQENLQEKSVQLATDDTLADKVTLAALKWYDLNRGIEEDLVLNIPQILKFEGNTGVYQLYTLVRVNSILEKNGFPDSSVTISWDTLNIEEQAIFKEMFIFPQIIESICQNYKPHILCNHLFSVATKINSWYTKYSVSAELDKDRKNTLLHWCKLIKTHLIESLQLLGIEPIDHL